MDEFNSLTVEALQKAWAALPKVSRPDAYLMNWSTWCKARRELKAKGIPVTYRHIRGHKWARYVEGVEVMIDRFITTEDVYEITKPPFSLDVRPSVPTVRKLAPGD